MKAISMDLGGSHATLAVVEDKTILAAQEIPLDSSAGLQPVLPLFKATLADLLITSKTDRRECIGVAMSIAAMTERDHVVSTNQKYDDATDLDLPAWSLENLGIPLALENDARMALMGEWYAGAAQGVDDVVMVTLGTGIGGAAMAGGKVYRSSHVQGGCLGGHIPVLFNGRRCTCGGFGCMEAEASGWALPLMAREWPGFSESRLASAKINFHNLFTFAEEGDPVCRELLDRCLKIWACGTAGLVHAYGPKRILFGGGVMRSGHLILPYIQEYVSKYSWSPSGPVEILPAALGNNAALLGAVPLLTGIAG